MKRFTALVLVLVMLTAAFGITNVFAADTNSAAKTFLVTEASSPGTTTEVTTIETGIEGMTLSVGADTWKFTEKSTNITTSIGSVKVNGYIAGGKSPSVKVTDEVYNVGDTGTYYSFKFDDSIETGSLEILYRGGTKPLFIIDNDKPVAGYDGNNVQESDQYQEASIMVQGGHTYTMYASGSKLWFLGCIFTKIDSDAFLKEIEDFSFDNIKGENPDKDHVSKDLPLIQAYASQFGSCDVSWTSTDTTVLDVDGTVNGKKQILQLH